MQGRSTSHPRPPHTSRSRWPAVRAERARRPQGAPLRVGKPQVCGGYPLCTEGHTHISYKSWGLVCGCRGRHRTVTRKLWRGQAWLSEHDLALTEGRFTRAPPMALPKFTVKKILRFPSCALFTSVPAPASSCSCVVDFLAPAMFTLGREANGDSEG